MKKLFVWKAESGVVHILPLLLIVAAVGIVSYLLISSTAPFHGGLFGNLFPKSQSLAAIGGIPDPIPNCQGPFSGIVPQGQAIPPYDPNTKLGGLEAEPQGPIWCFPLVQPTTNGLPTRVTGDNDWVDEFNTGVQMGRLNDGDMGYHVFYRNNGGNSQGQMFVNANHWMIDLAMMPDSIDLRPSAAMMLSPNRSFHQENGKLVIESDVAWGNDALGGADNFVEIDVSPAAAPDASRDYYGYGQFAEGVVGCRFQTQSGDLAIVCAHFAPWPVIPVPITETDAGNCANLPDANGNIYNCLSGHSTPDSTGDGYFNRLWETQGIGCSWMGGCSQTPNRRNFLRSCLTGQMDYFCRDRIRMEVTKTNIDIYVNGALTDSFGPFPSVIPSASTTAPGANGQIPDALLNNAHVYLTHWINDSSGQAFTTRTHWDRIAVNPHDLPGHIQPPTAAPSFCAGQPGNTCPILTQITSATGINVPAQNEVDMYDFVFNQQTTNTTVGSTITFVNKGTQPHSATADDGSWTTRNLGPGESQTITFNTPGVISFHCVPHPTMTGTITVYPTNGGPTPTPLPSTGATPTPAPVTQGTTFTATLNGANGVPVIATNGTGNATLILSTDQTRATLTMSFTGLTSSVNAAHIHGPAAPNQNAPVLFPLNFGSGTSGSNLQTTISGLTTPQVADLMNGNYYVNVHSTNFPSGEIRGTLLRAGQTPPPNATPTPGPTGTPIPQSTPTPTPAPVPTSTPAPIQIGNILGNNHVGAIIDSNDANNNDGIRVTTTSGGPVSAINVYVNNVDVAPNNMGQVGIYSDNNGSPLLPLAQSPQRTLTANSWNTFTINAALASNTTYWLMFNTNGLSTTSNTLRYDVGGQGGWSAFSTVFGAWPNPFGHVQSAPQNFSIYAVVGTSATPAPTPSPIILPTPIPTPTPGITTINFNNLTNVNQRLVGQYPSGIINWGTGAWFLAAPWLSFTTNSISFNGPSLTSASFTFVTPKTLVSMKAYNGDTTSSNITLNCGSQTRTATVPANQIVTITTGWTNTCTTVTVGSSNGWWTNFDDLVVR